MKRRLQTIIFLLAAFFLSHVTLLGQASGYSESNYFVENEVETGGFTEGNPGDKRPPKTQENKDSTDSRSIFPPNKTIPGNVKTGQAQPPDNFTEEDDSILSFNFLYFIIQKFKLQDIIE